MTKQRGVLWIMLCQVIASFTAELVNDVAVATFTAELVNVSSLFIIVSCFKRSICIVAESICVVTGIEDFLSKKASVNEEKSSKMKENNLVLYFRCSHFLVALSEAER